MGINAYVEDENGRRLRELLDPRGLLSPLLPDLSDETFHCLRFIDPYQDTTFNQRQMSTLIAEIRRIKPRARTREEADHLDAIEEFAREVRDGAHYYLKFYGD